MKPLSFPPRFLPRFPAASAPAGCRLGLPRSRRTGPVVLVMAILLMLGVTGSHAVQAAPLANGLRVSGTITVPKPAEVWSFAGVHGQNVLLRMGCDTFNPKIDLAGPDGGLLKSAGNASTGGRDAELSFQLPVDGTYTVTAGTYYAKGAGAYALTLASPPDPFTTAAGDDGGALGNGVFQTGQMDVGDLDLWSFPAAAGDSIILRMGTTGFNPQIRLYGPTGVLVATAANTGTGGRDAELSLSATNTGTFTVVVSAYYPGGTSPYQLTLAQAPAPFTTSAGDQGGELASGFQQAAELQVGDLDLWSFEAQPGEVIIARMGAAGFNPHLRLFGPGGAQVAAGFNSTSGGRDAELSVVAATAGTYLLVCSAYYAGGAGAYRVTAVRAGHDPSTAPGDEGGALANGAQQAGKLDVGDLDVWVFDTAAGDNLVLRMGATGFNPYLRLFGPTGAQVGAAFNGTSGARDAELVAQATVAGRYTLVVASYYTGGTSPYSVTLARCPAGFTTSEGDDGGPLRNGVQQAGTLDVGDLDLWSFQAGAGDDLILRMGATGYNPQVRLYGPTGALVASGFNSTSGGRDAEVSLQAAVAGTYTVVVSSYYVNGTGPYRLTLARSPGAFEVSDGDEGGTLANGYRHTATIDVGDLDLWRFPASSGDVILLRMGATGFNPQVRVYGPGGEVLGSGFNGTSGGRDVEVVTQATRDGDCTVVVSGYYLGGSGAYDLTWVGIPGTFSVAPGDEGGHLLSGVPAAAAVTVGDLDVWTFDACRDEHLSLRCERGSKDSALSPRLRLYGPGGQLVMQAQGPSAATLDYETVRSGRFTLVVGSLSLGGAGAYVLTGTGMAPDGLSLCRPHVTAGTLDLEGVGGPPGGRYVLETTSTLGTTPLVWQPLSTNALSDLGYLGYTNRMNPAELERYFRLREATQ